MMPYNETTLKNRENLMGTNKGTFMIYTMSFHSDNVLTVLLQSVDSGIDIGEQVLWNTEESFEEDLSTEMYERFKSIVNVAKSQ